MSSALPRLYAILDTTFLSTRQQAPLEVLDAWLDAGIRLVQLRAKSMPGGEMLELADRMQERVTAAGARLIINDRADVTRMSGAAGVHVGQDDLSPTDVRGVVGPDAIVGLSTHNLDQIAAAVLQPVSYVAIGPVFPTTTKGVTGDEPVLIAGVRRAFARTSEVRVPLVAIGGITLDRVREVLDAGAASVAVISDLCRGNSASRAREYLHALS